MDRTAYKTLLETKTKQVANLFTGSAYWDTENEGMLYAMDWIPQSGSIKLLEMNTNIGLTGRMIACVDLEKLTSHITSSGHSTCTYHEDYLNLNIEPKRLDDSMDVFKQELSSSLSSSGCTYTHDYLLWDEVIPTPSSTHYVLRQGHLNYHDVDILCENKTNFRNFCTSSLGEDFFPAFGSSISSSFSNPTNVPDVVIKDPTADMGVGVSFVDFTDDRNQIYNNFNYVEEYIVPEIDNGRHRIFRTICLIGSGSYEYLTKNETYQINYRQFTTNSGSTTIGSQTTNVYDSVNPRIWSTGHFPADTHVSMSDNTIKEIQNITPGEVVKSISITNYPSRDSEFISSDANTSWPQSSVDKGDWTGSLGDLTATTSSVDSLVVVPAFRQYQINNGVKIASEECIMVHSESVCQYKPVRDLIVGDKFVSRGNVTQSISSIDITNDVQLYYSLDLKDDNNYFVGGSNSVMSWDSYW